MPKDTPEKLKRDIRVLTQFLHNNHPLAEEPQASKSNDDFYLALSSMATLLTFQGGSHCLCVLGDFRHPEDVQLLVMEDIEQTPPPSTGEDVRLLFTHNSFSPESRRDNENEMMQAEKHGQITDVRDTLKLTEVPSSGKSLEQLAKTVPQDGLTPFSHAQDVVSALNEFHTEVVNDRSRISPCRRLLKEFFVRRCFHKLKLRIESDEEVLDKKPDKQPQHFHDLLYSWVDDEVAKRARGEMETEISEVAQGTPPKIITKFARKAGMKPNSNLKWELNGSNIHKWAGILANMLFKLHQQATLAGSSASSLSFNLILALLPGLRWFQRVNFLERIAKEKAFLTRLKTCYTPRKSLQSRAAVSSPPGISRGPDVGTGIGVSSVAERATEEGEELVTEEMESVFLRYMKGITAWESAISILTGSKWLHRPNMTFKVRQLLSPLAVDRVMTNVNDLAKERGGILKPDGKRKFVTNPKNFKGTIHCEALILSLMYLASQSKQNPFQDGFLKDFFEHCTPCIGVSRKMCWMCSQLRRILFPLRKLEIGESHGIIHPWNPPPNLPLNVLTELRDLLWEKFEIAVGGENDQSKSQRSSPAVSVVDSDDDVETDEELDNGLFQGLRF